MLVNDRASAVGDIDPSAVGDIDRRSRLVTVVIADVGGAVKVVSTPVEGGIEEDIDPSAVGCEPTTYQYRAPELFQKRSSDDVPIQVMFGQWG